MDKETTANKHWLKQLLVFFKSNTSLTVIISAVLLLELMMGVLFYSAQNFIQRTMERMVRIEMDAIYLNIRDKLTEVEVAVDNMTWVVSEGLDEPSWMFSITQRMVKNNSIFWGSGIAFLPDYYPRYGKYFEPYSVRRENDSTKSGQDSIVTMQYGKHKIDHTKKEYFRIPFEKGISHWSEPYYDKLGARSVITTYSAPIRDTSGNFVGVVFSDINLHILKGFMEDLRIYQSTQRYLVTCKYNRLAGEDSPLFRKIFKIVMADNDKTGYFTTEDQNGNKKHVFYTMLGEKTNWILINTLDDSEVFGRFYMMRMMLMLPVILGLLFAWLIVWRSSRNLKRFNEVNAEKARIDSELQVASRIQQSLLPQGELDMEDLEVEGFLKPAREVGGDLYDYYIRDGKLFFCVGDVSGKGAPSALLMSVVHTLFRSASTYESHPARIMQTVNEAACKGNDTNMFVTMFIGVLDLPTGRFRYCDAGHDAPFILSGTTPEPLPVNPHLPIGVFNDTEYTEQSTTLPPDSTIFLYTDGLTEAKNAQHHLFGIEHVKTILSSCIDLKPQDILTKVVKGIEGFVMHAEQSDDLTMLAIRYTPRQYEHTLTNTLTIKNDVREVTRFSTFIKAATEELGIDTPLARQLRLAVEEAVVNVIDYAYPPDTEGDITVNILSDGNTLHFQIIDSGVAFDPTTISKADTTLSAEDRKIGGLGILLVREQMDSINYERIDGKNILTLIKKLK